MGHPSVLPASETLLSIGLFRRPTCCTHGYVEMSVPLLGIPPPEELDPANSDGGMVSNLPPDKSNLALILLMSSCTRRSLASSDCSASLRSSFDRSVHRRA